MLGTCLNTGETWLLENLKVIFFMVTKNLAKLCFYSCSHFLSALQFFFPLPFSSQRSPQPPTLHLTKTRETCELVILVAGAQANSGGIRQARFHVLHTASCFLSLPLTLSVLQPVVTLTSGDHIGNIHTEMTQLQFEPRLLLFLLVCPLMRLYLPVSLAL